MWVPPQVEDRHKASSEAFTRELMEAVVRAELHRVKGVLDEFNYELRQIDPKLELVRCPENCDGTVLKPHYYAVVRWNEGAPPSVMLIEGPNGEFVEPSSALFRYLRESDLWDPANMRRLQERRRFAYEAEARFKAREQEERQEEIRDRVNAATRTSVSMTDAVPWTQNSSPASLRERARKKKAA